MLPPAVFRKIPVCAVSASLFVGAARPKASASRLAIVMLPPERSSTRPALSPFARMNVPPRAMAEAPPPAVPHAPLVARQPVVPPAVTGTDESREGTCVYGRLYFGVRLLLKKK